MPKALNRLVGQNRKRAASQTVYPKQKVNVSFQRVNTAFSKNRGQSSVEYLFVLVFLVGFVVAVIIPAVKESELSTALASARSAAIHFSAQNPDFFIGEINYTIQDRTVTLHPKVYFTNTTNPTPLPAAPPGLAQGMLDALESSVAQKIQGNCAQAANYAYCV